MAKILIIEDDLFLKNALGEFLTAEGFEVSSAIDGEAGIQKAFAEKPDLILLDIVLPRKDGYAVLQEIKSNVETAEIPIVLLTNLGSVSDVEKALELGATTYLVKADYKLDEVTMKIKEILGIE
ncbi:MAG: response regulator [Candidatus Moranbacteria bacterium]|nr:response regulator [Candidatus Moranbacteria bacterium]